MFNTMRIVASATKKQMDILAGSFYGSVNNVVSSAVKYSQVYSNNGMKTKFSYTGTLKYKNNGDLKTTSKIKELVYEVKQNGSWVEIYRAVFDKKVKYKSDISNIKQVIDKTTSSYNQGDVSSSLVLTGSYANDIFEGSRKEDNFYGLKGNDKIWGNDGNDQLMGDNGKDKLWGGNGKDELMGGNGNDKLWGGSGKDDLYGDGGDDELRGDSGGDSLVGGAGDDKLWGGAGKDRFHFYKDDDKDIIKDFENNRDTIYLGDNLWTGTKTVNQVLNQFGSVNGSDYVLDFGSGDILTIKNTTKSQLLNDIIIEVW